MSARLEIDYHQQEKSFYCGGASSQMVLHQIGVSYTENTCEGLQNSESCAESHELCQECLYTETQMRTRYPDELGWFSFPDGLTNTLNRRRPEEFARRFKFELFDEFDKSIITQKIVWTIHHYQVAPIVMIVPNHWVIVAGYDAPSDPVASDDPHYNVNSITGFWIHDPFPAANLDPSRPHFHDDPCGSGVIDDHDWGTKYKHVSLNEWFNDLLSPVADGAWVGQYLAVCDPDKAPSKGTAIIEKDRPYSGEKILNKDTAATLALKYLSDYGFPGKDFLPKQLKNIKAGKPLLVQRIDRKKEYYYIVPLKRDDNIYGTILIDARYGHYKQSSFPKNNGHVLKNKIFSRKEIIKLLTNEFGAFDNKTKKAIEVADSLVWKPCQESLSPNYPFQVVLIEDKPRFYIRTDGKPFIKLTTEGKGM